MNPIEELLGILDKQGVDTKPIEETIRKRRESGCVAETSGFVFSTPERARLAENVDRSFGINSPEDLRKYIKRNAG